MTDQTRPRHIEQVEAINAERAALPKDERVKREAADAPLLRIQLAYAIERAEQAEARTGPTDALEQRLAAMEKLAAAWQKEAERARKDCADQAYADDAIEFVVWSALDRHLDQTDVTLILKTIRNCRHLAAEALNVCADTWKAAEKRLRDLHYRDGDHCAICTEDFGRLNAPWPCATIRALENKA